MTEPIDWTQRDRRMIRLPRGAYAVAGSTWHVTLATRKDIAPPFVDDGFGQQVIRTLTDRCTKRSTLLHLYCLMPDHIHLLVEVRGADLVAVMSDLKSCIAREWWQTGGKGTPWQRGFHDRGIRDPKVFDEVMRYILENPVRAGLAANRRSCRSHATAAP